MTTHSTGGLTTTLTIEGAAVGACRNSSITINQAVIDTTSDDSSRWGEFVVGRRDWTIDLDGLYIYDDAAQIYLEEHITAANPASVTLIWTLPDGRTYSGTGLCTTLNISSPYEDAVTFSATIQGTDAITTSTS